MSRHGPKMSRHGPSWHRLGVRPVEILPVRAIVDAIEDPPSPLRVACDPMGAALLEAWRAGSDEESIAGCLAVFDVGGAQSARPSRI